MFKCPILNVLITHYFVCSSVLFYNGDFTYSKLRDFVLFPEIASRHNLKYYKNLNRVCSRPFPVSMKWRDFVSVSRMYEIARFRGRFPTIWNRLFSRFNIYKLSIYTVSMKSHISWSFPDFVKSPFFMFLNTIKIEIATFLDHFPFLWNCAISW